MAYMEMFLATLKPLSKMTDALSESKEVSITKVYPTVQQIKMECGQGITNDDLPDEMKKLSKTIRKTIWTYMQDK